MGAITGIDDLILRASDGSTGNPQRLFYSKTDRASNATLPTASGTHQSLWLPEGVRSGGATPGAVAVPNNTTPGGLLQNNPTGGRQLWMASLTSYHANPGYIVVYDRLLHIGGFSGTVTTAQTVGGSLTRYTNGIGNLIFAEIYTQLGASQSTITGAYTNQDGNAATIPINSSTLIGGTINQAVMAVVMLPLASGDTGVQGVTSVTLTNTTGTVGNWGITVAHPIAIIPCGDPASNTYTFDYLEWLPEILTNACIGMLFVGTNFESVNSFGNIVLVEA